MTSISWWERSIDALVKHMTPKGSLHNKKGLRLLKLLMDRWIVWAWCIIFLIIVQSHHQKHHYSFIPLTGSASGSPSSFSYSELFWTSLSHNRQLLSTHFSFIFLQALASSSLK